ncbi:PREDICTED: protein ROOT INITIATION DEFECTIVE 3 [Theobroma cacao]|uniref:Protein ROOT INITIATION DEFECTIVE 3 n=1 Tax=Theobroma cacao TaxID=3641 RepID=A0AB32W2Z3_THECC|nr:PREDICTED: protein ROOT INITIATION DEFECTIVE 3 [Theobroma cacao]
MGKNKDALVVCSDRSTGVGITVWELETGAQLLHIPTCAAAPHGLLCLRNQFLVASQCNRHGSFGGGAIFIWPLNKPRSPLRSYTMEAIGPLSCTKDGIYIAGGAPSGNAYLWEVANGRLLRTWRAHHKSLKCMVFSDDDSLLICGSNDGIIFVWSMISLLDVEDSGSSPPLLHCLSEHRSSITGLVTISVGARSIFVSSSLDGTCKVWDLVSGRLLQTQVYSTSITAITLHPVEQLLFSGSVDGKIFVNVLDLGPVEDPLVTTEDQAFVLKGHNGSITALTFSGFGLISASEDFTFCLWDTIKWVVARRFNHRKGAVTNMVVIKQSTLLPMSNHQKATNQFCVSLLQKYPEPANSGEGMSTFLSLSACRNQQTSTNFQGNNLLDHLIFDSEREQTPVMMQMKLERSMDDRMWVTSMTKHVMEMNKHLQSRLLDMMQCRLLCPYETDSSPKKKRQKLRTESPGLPEGQSHSAG